MPRTRRSPAPSTLPLSPAGTDDAPELPPVCAASGCTACRSLVEEDAEAGRAPSHRSHGARLLRSQRARYPYGPP